MPDFYACLSSFIAARLGRSILGYRLSDFFIAYNRKQVKMSTFFDNVRSASLPANFAQSVL